MSGSGACANADPLARSVVVAKVAGPCLLVATALAMVVAGIVLFVLPGVTLSAGFTHDLFVYLGGVHRVDQGQLPSRDFYSPLGLLGYYFPLLGWRLVGQFGGAMEAAGLLAMLATMPAAVVALANRVPVLPSLLILFAVFGLFMVPLNPGDGGGLVSQAMFYNRWCWAVLTLLFLFAIPPTRRPRNWVEAAAIAFLLLFLFFTKASYFVVGFVFVAVFGIALKRFRRAGVVGIALLLAVAAGVQWATGWVARYLADIHTAIEISGAVRTNLFDRKLLFVLGEYALVALAYACVAPRKRLRAVDALFALYVVGSSIPIVSQNAPAQYVFSLAALFAHLLALCRPAGNESAAGAASFRASRRMVAAALVVFLLPHLARQGVATVFFLGGALGGPSFADIRPMNLPRMEGVLIKESGEGEYVGTLRSGVRLLREQRVRNATVMTLDFANPFPVLLDLPAPRGDLWCIHVDRHINAETALAGPRLFADADYLMLPTNWRVRETRDFLLNIYGDYLAEAYSTAAENEHWRLLRRASAGAPLSRPP